jgi:hypothetical protein
MIKGVIDFDVSGGGGKACQLVAVTDILSLAAFGLGVENSHNGGGSIEIQLPAVPLLAGQTFWILKNVEAFSAYMEMDFGEEDVNWMTDNKMNGNGDDGVELFAGETVIDVYGDANTDGTGEAWEYRDAWARRRDSVMAPSSVFNIGEWEVAPDQCSDDAETNSASACPYSCGPRGMCPGYVVAGPTGGCVAGEGSSSVQSRTDTSEENISSGEISLTSSDLELTHDGKTEQVVAIVFPAVNIEHATSVTHASILFDVDEVRPGQSDAATTIAIYGEKVGSAAAMTSDAGSLSSRVPTKSAVRWNPEPSVATHDGLVTPDISSIVNEIVRQRDWSTGNAMCILFGHIDGSGSRWVESSRDNDGVSTPMLQWTVGCDGGGGTTGGGGGPVTDATFSVGGREFDSEEAVATGAIDLTSSDLELMHEGDAEQVVLIVFPSVTVPAGARVTHAQILFDVDEVRPGQSDMDTTITISGQMGVAAMPSDADHDITSRRTTRSTVVWQPEPSMSTHDDLTTPDIGVVIDEIVNGPGWRAGSNLGVVLGHVSGDGSRWAEASRTNNGVETPALLVSYSVK